MTPTLDRTWAGLVDDAAVFPPGDAPLPEAVEAHAGRRGEWWADLVGSFVVTDRAVPEIGQPLRLSVVVTGGLFCGACKPARSLLAL